MSQDAQQRVVRDRPLRLEAREKQRHGDGRRNHAERQIDAEQKSERDTQEPGIGDRLAEIGHPPPDDKAAQRSRKNSSANPRQRRTREKIVEHRRLRNRLKQLASILAGPIFRMWTFTAAQPPQKCKH